MGRGRAKNVDREWTNRVFYWRDLRGVTQQELADRVSTDKKKTHYQTIAKLENGETPLNDEWLTKISRVLNVRKADLLMDTAPDPRHTADLVGFVGVGSALYWEPHTGPWKTITQVETPLAVEGLKAVRVDGPYLEPRYYDGELLFFLPDQRDPADNIGRECIAVSGTEAVVCRLVGRVSQRIFRVRCLAGNEIGDRRIDYVLPIEGMSTRSKPIQRS